MSAHFIDEKPEGQRVNQGATGGSQVKPMCSHTFSGLAAQLGLEHGE